MRCLVRNRLFIPTDHEPRTLPQNHEPKLLQPNGRDHDDEHSAVIRRSSYRRSPELSGACKSSSRTCSATLPSILGAPGTWSGARQFFLLYYVMLYYVRLYYIIFCYIMCYILYLPPRCLWGHSRFQSCKGATGSVEPEVSVVFKGRFGILIMGRSGGASS